MLYEVMASDVKVVEDKNAKDGILSFSETGRLIKAAHENFVTTLHYEIQLLIPTFLYFFYTMNKFIK